jgi:SPP1 gp7 family putative phage head morphogenesis protein
VSVPRQSQLEQAITAFRARLLRLDEAALAMIQAAWAPAQDELISLIDDLTDEIGERGTLTTGEAMRLARAQRLLELIEQETTRLAATAGQVIPAAQAQAIAQAIERARALSILQAPDAASAAAVAREWTALNPRAMEHLVGALSDGSPLNDWLRQLAPDAVQAARDVLTDGVARGINPRDLAASLQRATGMPLQRAMTTARTTTMDSYRSASLESMRAQGSDILEGWQWSSAHGPRTCLSCLARDDGTVYPVTVQFFPSHPQCRCSPIPFLDDPDGLLPQIETGVQWFNNQPADVQRSRFPVGLRDDFDRGRVRLEDMSTLQRNEVYGDRFRQSTISEARENARRNGR